MINRYINEVCCSTPTGDFTVPVLNVTPITDGKGDIQYPITTPLGVLTVILHADNSYDYHAEFPVTSVDVDLQITYNEM